MKVLLPLVLFSLLACSLNAQSHDSTDIKLQHYKDMFVKGLISSQEYEALKAKTLGINQPTTIQEKPQANKELATKSAYNNDSIRKKEFCQITEIGAMVGLANYSGTFFNLKSIFGKRVNRNLFWGCGLGFDITRCSNYYDSPLFVRNTGLSSVPVPATLYMLSVTGSMKYYFIAKRISPFIGEDIGATYYNLSTSTPVQLVDVNGSNVEEGIIFKRNGAGARSITEVGFKYYVSNTIGIGFSISYLLQHLQVQTNAPESAINGAYDTAYKTETRFYHFMLINFILSFN